MKKSYSIFLSILFCFLFCSLSAQDAQLNAASRKVIPVMPQDMGVVEMYSAFAPYTDFISDTEEEG